MHARWDETSLFKNPKEDDPLDPFVRWLIATQARGLAQWVGTDPEDNTLEQVHIIARIEDTAGLDALVNGRVPFVKVAGVYGQALSKTSGRAHYFTAVVDASFEGLTWLLANPLQLRWELAMALRDAQRASPLSAKGRFGRSRDQQPMRAANRVKGFSRVGLNDRAQQLAGTIAVIDFGCPFLHDSFAGDTEGTTRLAAVWDQGQDPTRDPTKDFKSGWPWVRPSQFPNGRELGPKALAKLRKAAVDEKLSIDERQIYRGLDHLIEYADPRRRVWHATHGGMVLDIAGGRYDRLVPGTSKVDAAGRAHLVFVELPSLTSSDSAGGSLGAHVLDGIRYAMAASDPAEPLVVLICHGNAAGPHDGSSLIERAMDELIEARSGRMAIVLAAGNSRQQRGHVRRTVRKDRSVMLRLDVAAGDSTDSFVEIWYPRSGPALEIRVRTPDQVWSPWIAPRCEVWLRSVELPGTAARSAQPPGDEPRGEVVALLRHDRVVPNGDESLAILAIAPTATPSDIEGSVAAPGRWDIECRLAGNAKTEVTLDAWIERDDPLRGGGGLRTEFIDTDEDDQCNTLSALATGRHTIKAGGFNLETRRAAPYSSLPRFDALGRSATPHVLLAACEEDTQQPTVAAAATRSVDVYRMNGTSVAAPVLARRLFNAMVEHGPFDLDALGNLLAKWAESGTDPALRGLDRKTVDSSAP